MLRFLTAGESHGPSLTVILEGLPAGLPVSAERINRELTRRQRGFGRGERMQIETDRAIFTSGVRHGQTLGSPVTLVIANRDWENWKTIMSPEPVGPAGRERAVFQPRPGHADMTGALKYDREDMRDILERASARETTARVAAGAMAKLLLEALEAHIGSWVETIGPMRPQALSGSPARLFARAEKSDVRCPEPKTAAAIRRAIEQARQNGDTLGGIFTVAAWGLPVGLGSHVQWDRKLDMRLGGAIMSIQAIKGVEIGLGFAAAGRPGSQVHDPIVFRRGLGFRRAGNNAGGLEGGMTTGEPLLVRAAMKPISTLKKPLSSVDLRTHKSAKAVYERSDVCAVPAAAVVAEAMTALVLAQACLEKFGGDSLREIQTNWKAYLRRIKQR